MTTFVYIKTTTLITCGCIPVTNDIFIVNTECRIRHYSVKHHHIPDGLLGLANWWF